jgi:hypothetical protein
VFLFGFAKSDRENIEPDELTTVREIARDLLAANNEGLARAIAEGELQELSYDDEEA